MNDVQTESISDHPIVSTDSQVGGLDSHRESDTSAKQRAQQRVQLSMNAFVMTVIGVVFGIAWINRNSIVESVQSLHQRTSNPANLVLWMGGSDKTTQDLAEGFSKSIETTDFKWQDEFQGNNETIQKALKDASLLTNQLNHEWQKPLQNSLRINAPNR